jgi:hypothetical protein
LRHSCPWPYYEVLIVNRGYYGYVKYKLGHDCWLCVANLDCRAIAVGMGSKNHPATAKPGSVTGYHTHTTTRVGTQFVALGRLPFDAFKNLMTCPFTT